MTQWGMSVLNSGPDLGKPKRNESLCRLSAVFTVLIILTGLVSWSTPAHATVCNATTLTWSETTGGVKKTCTGDIRKGESTGYGDKYVTVTSTGTDNHGSAVFLCQASGVWLNTINSPSGSTVRISPTCATANTPETSVVTIEETDPVADICTPYSSTCAALVATGGCTAAKQGQTCNTRYCPNGNLLPGSRLTATWQCDQGKNVSGVCNTDMVNGCSAGTLFDQPDDAGASQYKWQCVGNNGTTANCSKPFSETDWNSYGCGKTHAEFNGVCGATAPLTPMDCATGQHVEYRDIFDCPAASGNNPSRRELRCVADTTGCGTVSSPLCGSANGNEYTTAPAKTSQLCTSGTPSMVAGNGPWSWTCTTDTTVSCSALSCIQQCTAGIIDPIPGVCESTTLNGCGNGVAATLMSSDEDKNYWYCPGIAGGTTSPRCFKGITRPGVCNNNIKDGCSTGGVFNSTDDGDQFLWFCSGPYGGAPSPQCAKGIPRVGVCNTDYVQGCNTGSPVSYTQTADDDKWYCAGSYGAANSPQCVRPIAKAGVCNNAQVNGCTIGTAINGTSDANGNYWICQGIAGGGNSTQCLKASSCTAGP